MIGFNLTEEQKEMQAFFRKFSQERVKAAAEKMDEEEKMDMDLIHEMQSLGMFGIPFSEEVGGAGLDVFNYVLLMEELSKAVIELQLSYGLSLRTIQKMVRDVYKNTNDAPPTGITPKTTKSKSTK